VVSVRPGRLEDDAALLVIDRATWTPETSPAPIPADRQAFFDERTTPEDVLVAEVDGEVAGYVKLSLATPLPASTHVRMISGLAVDPARYRQGVGRALLDAAAVAAREQGATRLTLRVLAHNEGARRLYESAGFVVEGILRGEFVLDGVAVDDVLMALSL
jgi:ribosomal protein S18 acetylase RimI-like enzyme